MGQQPQLSDEQVGELRRASMSRRGPAALRRRAAIVLAEHHARTAGAEPSNEVPRQTARRWYERYARNGLSGMADAPRSGRPPTLDQSVETSVLAAPLYADSLRWTSRSIAAAVGTTQSAVARTWKKTYETGMTELGDSLPAGRLRLEAAGGDESGSVLVLRVTSPPSPDPGPAKDFMRSAVRPALQTVLAVDMAAMSVLATKSIDREESGARGALLASLEERDSPGATYTICSSATLAAHAQGIDPATAALHVDRSRWQGLLVDLGTRLDPGSLEALTQAQQAAMRWATYPDTGFTWVLDDSLSAPTPAPRAPASLATTDLVAEAVVLALVDDISAGRLGGGDRITETHLTRVTHATRGQVRDALQVLASRGIIDLEPHRGAVVPTPTVEDVVETYAARRALGALLVRRAAEVSTSRTSGTLVTALAAMLTTAEGGDAIATGEEDFKLQEAIAEMSGMRRVPAMFSSLTAQLRLFVAVLRLRYGYSIPAMCQDDIELVELIRAGDGAGAVQKWNTKMNDAATYMLHQLELRDRGRRRTT
jgi:DNA-binding GntR family transcriptional regulator